MTDELNIVAWSYEFHDFGDVWGRGIVLNRPDGGANPPTKHYGSDVRNVQALCRHDEAMAEIERLTKERDAAFAMSRCECGTDESCANLVAKDGEIERLQAENAKLTVACAAYEVEAAGLREQLAGSDENTLLRHLAYIRQKSGVGMKPMLSELADAIAEKINGERNKALEDAATWHDAKVAEYTKQIAENNAYMERTGRTSAESRANEYCFDQRSMHRVSAAAIRAMKENKNEN